MRPRPGRVHFILPILMAGGCPYPVAGPPGHGPDTDITGVTGHTTGAPGDTSGEAADSTTSEAEPDGSSDESSAVAGTTLVLDVGGAQDLGPEQPAGCRGKIDFLFVISRWGYMELLQSRLIEAFPEFIATIEAKFADFDYHIMVVDGDDTWGAELCGDVCGDGGCEAIPEYPCDQLHLVTECDHQIGAGNVFAAGKHAANKPCELAGGRRYMTRDQPDPVSTFACMAQLGINGDDWLGEALMSAVRPDLNGPGRCNEGFLRDDALLMVTLISNGYDQGGKPFGSSGTPEQWAEAVIDAKHGDLESVVMLSILDPACEPNDRTCKMVEMFPNSLVTSYEDDFGAAFEAATAIVDHACADFVPPPV